MSIRTCPAWPAANFVPADPGLLTPADLVFLALPHGESAALAARLPRGTAVVDLGADFRLADRRGLGRLLPDAATPGTGHTGCPNCPGPGPRISAARRVAAPGCYATAAILALAPLLAAGPGRAAATS